MTTALAFLYPLFGHVLALLVIPLAFGILIALIPLPARIRARDSKAIAFSGAAFVHNIVFVMVEFLYLRAWFEVFGD